MFNFKKTPSEYGSGAYLCKQEKYENYKVGDVITVGVISYRILEIDSQNQMMIIQLYNRPEESNE